MQSDRIALNPMVYYPRNMDIAESRFIAYSELLLLLLLLPPVSAAGTALGLSLIRFFLYKFVSIIDNNGPST